ncbi:uncharacterized protein LOC117170741 [Belonocnema kinseyi]|uniref:uncharacterized protein LOC117170741 n=1 Tax=Belonocnema kinseyi TaxID=2817044 RepID=UPI00143DCE02|nr:uncharacterized protein LOC117170741 [Belonocnema kinseyi]
MKADILIFACLALRSLTIVGGMDEHEHIHYTTPTIQRPHPLHPTRPESDILIQKVVSGIRVDWNIVFGELLPDQNLVKCNGPYGHVTVKISDGKILYACLEAGPTYDHHRANEHYEGVNETYYCYVRVLEGYNVAGYLTHGNEKRQEIGYPTGHVHYIQKNKIDVQGDLYITNE